MSWSWWLLRTVVLHSERRKGRVAPVDTPLTVTTLPTSVSPKSRWLTVSYLLLPVAVLPAMALYGTLARSLIFAAGLI